MDRTAIAIELQRVHEAFVATIRSFPEDRLEVRPHGKWSPAQHLEHIRMSVRPVATALLVPRWFLRWRFGTPNRPPRSYEALVQRYKEKLAAGGKAPSPFTPLEIRAGQVVQTSEALLRSVHRLCERTQRWSDLDLDRYLLPHPLLGRLTIREMLFFTIHHAQHHKALVERDHH